VKLVTFASRDLKRANLKFSKSRTQNASLIYKTRVLSLKKWSSPGSHLKNLRLRSQQARVSSINAKGAFVEHGRTNLKKEVSGRGQETKSLHGQ